MIDSAFIQYMYRKQDTIDMIIDAKSNVSMSKKEKLELFEKIYIEYEFFVDKFFPENYKYDDKIIPITVFNKKDIVSMCDNIVITPYLE